MKRKTSSLEPSPLLLLSESLQSEEKRFVVPDRVVPLGQVFSTKI